MSKKTDSKEQTINLTATVADVPKFDILTARSRKGFVKLVNKKLAEGFYGIGPPWVIDGLWTMAVIKRRAYPSHNWVSTDSDKSKKTEGPES